MKIILAVVRSRSQALDFISKLRANGLSATAVSTPKEANVGCGISAKINEAELSRARRVAQNYRFSAFVGFYAFEFKYGKNFVYPLNG